MVGLPRMLSLQELFMIVQQTQLPDDVRQIYHCSEAFKEL